eukprot:TRINITY_DN748_c0_g1_i2.p1 TRINITY_DN748_c0_g1~~TRINITY_DN748_c0_g1_i2.p1  ORF type:complete len:134 (-),score=13.28 TRINITY_DN748_c0_g1_i2:85-438(-)
MNLSAVIFFAVLATVSAKQFIISKESHELLFANQTFTQKDCTNSECTQGCQSHSFPANTCLQVQGGGSAKASCEPPNLVEKIWTNSDCSGNPSQTGKAPLNKCLQASNGGYFENICS